MCKNSSQQKKKLKTFQQNRMSLKGTSNVYFLCYWQNKHTNISLNLDMPLTSVKSSFSSITFMNHLPVLFVKRELFRNQKLNLKSGMESFKGRSDTLVWKSKLLYQSFKQRFAKISQSRRRLSLLALSHWNLPMVCIVSWCECWCDDSKYGKLMWCIWLA